MNRPENSILKFFFAILVKVFFSLSGQKMMPGITSSSKMYKAELPCVFFFMVFPSQIRDVDMHPAGREVKTVQA